MIVIAVWETDNDGYKALDEGTDDLKAVIQAIYGEEAIELVGWTSILFHEPINEEGWWLILDGIRRQIT